MNQPNDQNEKDEEPGLALGIDLGNSKISAAIWNRKRKAPSIVLIDEKQQLPSTIYFKGIIPKNEERQNEEINITEDSFDVGADYSSDKNVEYYLYDIKKLLGQKTSNEELVDIIQNLKYKITEDQDNNILYSLEGNGISFDFLLKLIINKIKISAENQFNDKVINCTISVPHSFNNNQRMAIKNAAYNSGIKNIYIINEPLSTAIYYASKNKIQKNENILIVDFGSSKLDVTLLSVTNKNSIKVRATGGDATLGGDIFNSEMKNDILRSFKIEGGSDINDPKKLLQLENLIEKAKKELTFKEEAEEIRINQFDDKTDLIYSIKRQNFNSINNEVYDQIYKTINKVIVESKIPLKELNHIILQGDAIRVVGLTNLIRKKFENIDIITDLYDSIAYGNAIYTAKKMDVMNNKQFDNFKIYDITPISLGIRTEGDLMSIILPRGSRVPIKAIKRFNTTEDNQNNIKIEIYEGERKLIKDNILLKKIIIKNLPLKYKKEVKVEVCFEVDEEFILTVTAKELSNNIQKSCQVVINENLSQGQILKMLEDSKKYEKEDKKEKERIKAMLKLNDKIFEYCHYFEGNENILRELEGYRTWIKHSPHALKEEYEKQLKELNDKMSKEKNSNSNTRKQTETNTKKTD